ncbi:ABC transporter permease [Chitinophaga pendula]|uniref:ABC transporter permease n=1 Tax=Chitinophaga TaxID=79328 RepID=UPI000BB0ADDC|nr:MULTISPECIES: ABC transporter permease [Chitinophaga]ASZ13294.1 hypothetical protein CK934_21185 [Chitinophaga sp. MD30]UCJ09084.1 ABC transporter permease [Chitinophaga pendula]
MFIPYLKIAWRNIVKDRLFSGINIIGLAIGIAACLLILQYVAFKLSFDQFNKNVDNLYRVVNDRYQNGKLVQHGTITYSAIGKAMKDDYEEVIANSRVEPFRQQIVTYNETKIGDQEVLAVDNAFLTMFSYPLIAGDQTAALKEPNTIVVTESLAKKLFGIKDDNLQAALGKPIIMSRDSLPYRVTGVVKDVPENSHLQFDMLMSYVSLYSGGNINWTAADYDFKESDFWHYVQLKPGTDYHQLENKLTGFSQKYFDGIKVSGSIEKFYLQPLSNAHLYSDFEYEIGKTDSSTIVWGLLIIAVLIIVIAIVNYTNLSTARSMNRAKEVGVRKAVGATRELLIQQFMIESLLVNVIAILLAIVIIFSVQNAFNNLIQTKLSLPYLLAAGMGNYKLTFALIGLCLLSVLGAGFYPAFVLSAFKPILVLKGNYVSSGKGIFMRKALMVGQFTITAGLIIGSIVIYRQLSYMNNQKLGMDIEQVLIVKPPILTGADSSFADKTNSFKGEVKNIPNVLNAVTSRRVPGEEMGRAFNVHRADMDTRANLTMRHMNIDEGFIKLYDVKLVAGRNFTTIDNSTKAVASHNIILNEAAVKLLGFNNDEDAIGKKVVVFNNERDVVGVVKDFHQKSLRYKVEPTILLPNNYSTESPISIKVNTKDLNTTIAAVKERYLQFFPGNLFEFYFLDEQFNNQYSNERLFSRVFTIFTGLAIFTACLGLMGLSIFTSAQRAKEISVRKVLGASDTTIFMLLSRDFVRLSAIAFVIASPVAWFVMNQWLLNFAYRVDISWWIFVLSGILLVIITLVTISMQTIKAAQVAAIKNLRS